jgi:hypothetical protein
VRGIVTDVYLKLYKRSLMDVDESDKFSHQIDIHPMKDIMLNSLAEEVVANNGVRARRGIRKVPNSNAKKLDSRQMCEVKRRDICEMDAGSLIQRSQIQRSH